VSDILSYQQLRLKLKWVHFYQNLRGGRSAAQWAQSLGKRTRRTLLEGSLRRGYQRRAELHRPLLPQVSADARKILDSVEETGVHVAPIASLDFPHTDEILDSANILLPELARTPTPPGGFTALLDRSHLTTHPQLFLWGLNDKLLDIVENYMGVPVGYAGVNLSRSVTNDIQRGTRMWHFDPPDHRMLRIIIYLNDVDQDNGPFQYIPKGPSARARQVLSYSNEAVPDDIMCKVTRPEDCKTCLGPRGTAIFVDPANVFHRAKVPNGRERLAIFYTHHSTKPLNESYLRKPCAPEILASLEDKLNERQRACVFWRD